MPLTEPPVPPPTPPQVSELSGQVGALAKGRDSALSKMNLWMKTCKQLQQEKETLVQNSGKNKLARYC